MHLRPNLRSWSKRLLVGAVVLAALYPFAANFFLLPAVGPALLSRRPERFRITWQSAWSLWPGEVRFRGLEIRGRQPRVHWWITAEQGAARIDLPALLRREVRIEHLSARGIRSRTERVPPPPTSVSVQALAPAARRTPWTIRLERIELAGVRELGYGPLLLEGNGQAAGSFRLALRREMELGATVLTMPRGRLRMNGGEVAREVDVQAELRLGPYFPREHRGIAGFDFLSGRLIANGNVEELSILERIGEPAGLGNLAVDLRLEQGRLVPGSRLRFSSGSEAPARLAVSGEVNDRLVLTVEAARLALRRQDGAPFLAAETARLTASSPELRLSRLIAGARTGRALEPLRGDVEATGLRLWAAGRMVAAPIMVEITAEQGRGQIGLAALLGRQVVLDGLRASGVAVRIERGLRPPAAPSGARQSWRLEMADARIEQLREFRMDSLRVAGNGGLAGSLSWNGSELAIREGSLELRRGRAWRGTEELARGVEAHLAGGLAPCALRRHPGLAALDCATLDLRATAEVPRLEALSMIGARGPLRANLRIERGALRPGSTLEIGSRRGGSAVIARFEGGEEPRLSAEVRNLALGGGSGRPPLLRAAAVRASVVADDLRVGRFLAGLRGRGVPPEAEVEVAGLEMGAIGERIAWSLTLDRMNGKVDLGGLARQEAALSALRGAGARLAVRKSEPGEWSAASPDAPPWSVRIADVRITGVREAAFGPNRLLGNGQIEGNLAAAFGGGTASCRLDRLALTFGSARIESDRKLVAHGVSVLSDLRIAPFTPGELRGASLFRLISGSLAVDGDVSSLGFLRAYFRKAFVLDGSGHLSADVRLAAGRLLPGTRLTVDPAEVEAEVLLSRATGSATVQGMVLPGPGEPHLVLGVDFGHFQIAARDPGDAPPHVVGEGMQLSLTSSDLDLATPGKNALARIVLPEAEVRDLAFYNGYLPAGTGVSILGGAGRLAFDFRVQTESQIAQGELTLRSDAVRVRVEDLELAGVLDLRARLASPDLRTRRFTLDGTRLALESVELRHVGPDAGPPGGRKRETSWWARVDLDRGSMDWTRPLALTSTVRLEMKDAGFLLSLLASRKPYLAWFGDRLRNTPLVARGELRLAQGSIEVAPLEVLGGHFDIRTRLRLSRERRHGHLFVRWRRLALGVDLEGRERRYRFLRPLEWFQNQRLGE